MDFKSRVFYVLYDMSQALLRRRNPEIQYPLDQFDINFISHYAAMIDADVEQEGDWTTFLSQLQPIEKRSGMKYIFYIYFIKYMT